MQLGWQEDVNGSSDPAVLYALPPTHLTFKKAIELEV